MGGASVGSSGFGGSFGGGGAGGSSDQSCDSLIEETVIASPKATAVRMLSVDEKLNIVLSAGDSPPVRAERVDGTLVGTVMPTFLVRLVECIRSGTIYEAVVISIDGGAVFIQIQPKA